MQATSPLFLVHELAAELKLSYEAKASLTALYLRYAFAAINSDVFTEEVNRLFIPADVERLRPSRSQKSIRNNGPLLLVIKGWVYHEFCSTSSKCTANVGLNTYDVQAADKRLLRKALLDPKLRRDLAGLVTDGYVPLDEKRASAMMDEALQSKDYTTYTSKFLSKKLFFLQKSYGYRMPEIKSDLIEASLFSMLRMFPAWASHGFLLSVCKMATKRRGQNLIQEFTTQKRQALLRDAQGNFTAVNVSWEQMLEVHGEDAQGSANLYGEQETSYFDNSVFRVFQELVFKVNSPLTDLQKTYLRLASGEYDEAFSEWLQSPSDVVADKLSFDRWNTKVCSFLGIPKDASLDFLQSLKAHF